MTPATFAARLRALRERAKLSPTKLAEAAGLTQQALSLLERNNSGNWWTWSLYVCAGDEWHRLGKSVSAELIHDQRYHAEFMRGKSSPWQYVVNL